jgi:hypothetical protein
MIAVSSARRLVRDPSPIYEAFFVDEAQRKNCSAFHRGEKPPDAWDKF